MKFLANKILPILTGIYALLYLLAMGDFIMGSDSLLTLENVYVLFLFSLFLVGFAFSWIHRKIAGIILLIWYAAVWVLNLFIAAEGSGGMTIVLGLPIMVIGAFLILQWYKKASSHLPNKIKPWKIILQALLLEYGLIYIAVVIKGILEGDQAYLLGWPGMIFPILLLFFLAGFILSWKRERLAGALFLMWYAIALIGSLSYFEIYDSGPAFFGFPLLLHGIFYVIPK